MTDKIMIEDGRLSDLLFRLNEGAAIMDAASDDNDKMPGARIVSEVGAELVEEGGHDLLKRAHGMALPEYQRTIEVQWGGLTDAQGRQWRP